MNGMTRKKLRREHARTHTEDGVPRDAREWTEVDWATLHRHMEAVRREVGDRHKEECDGRSCHGA